MRQITTLANLFELEAVTAVARDAGAAIRAIYHDYNHQQNDEHNDVGSARIGATTVAITQKADNSPLTSADLAAHHVIAQGLKRLTPNIPVVSEEDAASLSHRQPDGRFWLIDPMDGTKEFISRNGEFTVNIALIDQGVPVFGVVYAPVPDQMYWGSAQSGAFCEQAGQVRSIRVAASVGPDALCRVLASKSHLNLETSAFIARLGRHALVQAGSSLKFCRIAEGQADVYPRLAPTCEWDTAAAQAVLEAAGGFVYDLAGVRLAYGKPDVLNPSFIAASVPMAQLRHA